MDWNSLWTKFESTADLFITEINPNIIVLNFKPSELTSISPIDNQIPQGIDRLGGRVPVDAMEGRMFESTGNYYEQPVSISISGRIYWSLKPSDSELLGLNIKNVQDVCKMTTYNSYSTNINNADTATIDGYKCRLIRKPLPHGLGGNQYCNSIWEIIQ